MSAVTTEDAGAATTPDPTRSGGRIERAFRWWLAGIMAVGLAVRVAFVVIRQSSVELVTGDAYWYHFQAKLVAEGKGFLHPFEYFKHGVRAPGADHPPGFVTILAVLDLLGIDSPQGQRLAMCVVGTASIAVVGLLGRRLGGPVVGLIAAGLAAIYPNIWINDGMLMVETVFIFATAVSLLACYRYLERHDRRDLLVMSAALTLGATTRPESIVLFGILLLPVVLLRRQLTWTQRALHLVLAALVPVVVFAPWVVYNLGRFEAPVLISTGAGQTLAAGNCDLTYSGSHLGFYDTRCLLAPQIEEPTTEDLSLRDGEYRRIAMDYMSEHRGELPKVMAARIGRVWHLYRPGQSIGLDGWIEGRSGGPPGTSFGLVREALWSYYALMPLAAVGLVVLKRRRQEIWPMLAQPVLVTVVAAMTFGITRYRAGVEVSVVVCAALAIGAILPGRLGRAAPPQDTDASTTTRG